VWIYPIGKKCGNRYGRQTLLYKPCKISRLGKVAEETDGGFRDQQSLRINNLRPGIDVHGNSLFRHE
jgi:hypothetical protein